MDNENNTTPEGNPRVEKYGNHYNEKDFWAKLNSMPRSAVKMILEKAMLLRELLLDGATPYWVRGILLGALGYIIFPFDLCPDLIPGIGYMDDIAVAGLVLGNLDHLVSDEIRERVQERMGEPLESDAEATT